MPNLWVVIYVKVFKIVLRPQGLSCQVVSKKQKCHITQASGGSHLSWSKARNVYDYRVTLAHQDLPEQQAGLTAVDLGEGWRTELLLMFAVWKILLH